jgi:hypothetical protein
MRIDCLLREVSRGLEGDANYTASKEILGWGGALQHEEFRCILLSEARNNEKRKERFERNGGPAPNPRDPSYTTACVESAFKPKPLTDKLDGDTDGLSHVSLYYFVFLTRQTRDTV